jgi:hypothetical protein
MTSQVGFRRKPIFTAVVLTCLCSLSLAAPRHADGDAPVAAISKARPLIWENPGNISARDLYYGPGGKEHAPHTTFTFLKEDLQGSNPKFDVQDQDGTKWKVKLGGEAKPEVVAARFVWAVGYFANEDYFLPVLHVEQMPHLKRGQHQVKDGTVHDVRLKRSEKAEKKIGEWKWNDNPFSNQRELNGLRVMMALLNNWDLKDVNNAVYEEKSKDEDSADLHYLVSDLGATFGTAGRSVGEGVSKGNLKSYRHSKFISKVTPEYVDFNVPGRPASLYLLTSTGEYMNRTHMRWIGKHIPRSDARWIAGYLAQLTPEQIRDAFRAAGYSPDQVEGYATVVEKRIAELRAL